MTTLLLRREISFKKTAFRVTNGNVFILTRSATRGKSGSEELNMLAHSQSHNTTRKKSAHMSLSIVDSLSNLTWKNHTPMNEQCQAERQDD
ncbi:unnamed protein product [Allacma fusca]|uniref:Uncharacterized protein n=1 Tax=Allacma fusca TaxID=39272 RepID=A0A8J2JLS0_9HEXA|nr:unnamed protein product [Allacma fusca]